MIRAIVDKEYPLPSGRVVQTIYSPGNMVALMDKDGATLLMTIFWSIGQTDLIVMLDDDTEVHINDVPADDDYQAALNIALDYLKAQHLRTKNETQNP